MKTLRFLLLPVLFWLVLPAAEILAQCNAPFPSGLASNPTTAVQTILSWNQVAAYTTYRVTVVNTTTSATILNNVLVTGTSKTVNGLNTSDQYTATVKVQCSTGNVSPNTATLNFAICPLPAPENFEAFLVTGAPLEIQWSWDTVPGAVGYVLEVLDMTTNVLATINTVSPFVITDAIPGHSYHGTLAAVCANGSVSPNKTVRVVDGIIIEDVLQLTAPPGCGMENSTCGIFNPPPATNYTIASTVVSYTTPVISLPFNGGQSRQVLRIKIVPATGKQVEFKLAFDRLSMNLKYRFIPPVPAAVGVGYTAGVVGGNMVEVNKVATSGAPLKRGFLKVINLVPTSTATTFQIEIGKDSGFPWRLSRWLCATCIPNPLPSDGGADEGEISLEIVPEGERPALGETALESFPNPTKDRAVLRFVLPGEETVSLSLFNSAGTLVREILHEEWHEAGVHDLEPDLSGLPAGVYRCVLRTGTETRSCLLVKM